jgi:signal transduction histidine kinase
MRNSPSDKPFNTMIDAVISKIDIQNEQDIVFARQRSRQIAELLGFDTQDQTRIATAVSEIARNAYQYAQGGRIEFRLDPEPHQLVITVRDYGHGIPNLTDILDGTYRSTTGAGQGIAGTRRLMDDFQIHSTSQGTLVRLIKVLPKRISVTAEFINDITQTLIERYGLQTSEESMRTAYTELQQQNQELLRTLEELRQRESDLATVNRELEETNRGVLALYAELDARATALQEANDTKTRFLSNMSHEFRTPVNSILSLTRLLIGRVDGDLSTEQEKQVIFIRTAAESLSELVNDLLDLAKVEAGKVEIQPVQFQVCELFGTLRGLFRPLLPTNAPVALVIEDTSELPPLHTDDRKVAQILRNLISNALKFTECGTVRVRAECQGDWIHFLVSDSGIGIAQADYARIFDDFVQIDSPRQRTVKGTGLGLPLSRKLAELLGGYISVWSKLGVGSTFTLAIPTNYVNLVKTSIMPSSSFLPQERFSTNTSSSILNKATRSFILLVIDDDAIARYVIRQCVGSSIRIVEAATGLDGLQSAKLLQPQAIVLDLAMPGLSGFEVLNALKNSPETASIPVIIHTARSLTEDERLYLEATAIAVLVKGTEPTKIHQDFQALLTQLGFVLDLSPTHVSATIDNPMY